MNGAHDWSLSYRPLGPFPAESGAGAVWHSPARADPWWDDFLRGTPCGQFQQSSLWADYKAAEGWVHHRVILTGAFGILGGYQILWKKIRWGRIGYVSKGPVLHPESSPLARELGRSLAGAARQLGLVALIVQPPDESLIEAGVYAQAGLVRSNPMRTIESTYLVDVRGEMEVLRGKMSPSLRRNLRHARKRQVVVREGTAEDLPRFFALMEATCRRQKTAPNPGSVEAVRRVWSSFSPSNSIRLTLAEHAGTTLAAKLCLLFGERVSLWKKGWDGSRGELHSNELLEDEAMEWAHTRGCRICDFCSLGRSTARRLLQGIPVAGAGLSTRDEYHLRFAGYPKLLPPSLVLIPNPLLRWGYRNTFARLEGRRDRRSAKMARGADPRPQ